MSNELDEILKFLSSEFSKFNTVDLISKISSLRLLPQNGDHQIRLDAFLHAAATNQNDGNKNVNRGELNKIINSSKVKNSYITHAEDPRTQLLCEEISFFGGGYRIFPGVYNSIVFNFNHLLKSLFLTKNKFLDKKLLNELNGLSKFILEINESIAARAKIKRNTDISFYGEIFIPPINQLKKIAEYVKFSFDELKCIINKCNITIENIKWLFTELCQLDVDLYSVEKGPLLDAPIIFNGNTFIITDPSSLLASFQKKVFEIMKNNNLLKEFCESYSGAMWDTVVKKLDWMNIKKIDSFPNRVHNDIPVIDGLFSFEQDKVLVCILVFDDFSSSESDSYSIDLNDFSDKFKLYSDILYHFPSPPNQILYLFLSSHYFRPFQYSFFSPFYDDLALALSIDDLNIISILEGGKNNFLLKYSIAQTKIRDVSQIIVINNLSEYDFFKNHDYSYYFDDERRPTMMYITDDFARASRAKALEKIDSHTVFNPLKNSHVEVLSLSGKELPLYIPHYIPDNVEVVLESFSVQIWFYNNYLKGKFQSIAIEFIDMIGYWFNELKPGLQEIMNTLKGSINNIIIEIDLEDSELWEVTKNMLDEKTQPLQIEFDGDNQFRFIFSPVSNFYLFGDTNEGERKIIYKILNGMKPIFEKNNVEHENLLELNLQSLIDEYLPLGRKKKLCTYNTALVPEIDIRNIPPLRKNQEIDTNILLDEIGNNVFEQNISIGRTNEEQARFINQYIVYYLWNKLKSLIKKFDINSILKYLLAQNEALIRQKTLYEIQIPMRLAITESDRVMKEFRESYNNVINSGPACRFLIELVTATNPHGLKKFSDSDYDELLAISKELIHWGFTSDLIFSKITDMQISILPSKRIGSSRKAFDLASKNFSRQIEKNRINKFSLKFKRYWEKGIPQKNKEPLMVELDNALFLEYGFYLDDLIEFKNFLFRISESENSTIMQIEEHIFYDKLRVEKLNEDRIKNLLKHLTLHQRAEFFSYLELKNIRKEDFYPWRFNRRISYIRKPILKYINNSQIPSIAFGIRQIQISVENFIGLLGNGKLQNEVSSKELKSILGKLAEPSGKKFNENVAEIFNHHKRFILEKNVEKFGKLKIENSKKQSLGDIDVFVIDLKSNKILLIECKDLLIARTPYEIMLELRKVYEVEKSLMKKFQNRIEWCNKNINEIINYYKLNTNRKWKIKPYFIVNEPLFSSHLKKFENINTLTFLEVKEKYKIK